jgi:hypothetical protein
MEPAHSETGNCRVEPPASILVARLSMSHLVPLLEFNQGEVQKLLDAVEISTHTGFATGQRGAPVAAGNPGLGLDCRAIH